MQVEKISYQIGGNEHGGALVYEKTGQPRPALLIAPNWLGVTDAFIEHAQTLIGDRYIGFVADMYGAGKAPKDRSEAAPLANGIRGNPDEHRTRIRAAYDVMLAEVEKRGLGNGRVLAAGFCFGGGNVMELARSGARLDAVGTFHGDLKTGRPAAPGAITCPILVMTGAADPAVPKADRDAFEKEMTEAKAKWQMLVFSDVVHSFTDPKAAAPGASMYDEPAARQSYTLFHQFMADAIAGRL